MNTIVLKTIGSAPKKEIEITGDKLADFIQGEISGSRVADEEKYPFMTQEFADKYGFTARYTSGTFLGLKYNEKMFDELVAEFRAFGK